MQLNKSQNVTNDLNSLFCNNKLKSCLVNESSSSSMDILLNLPQEKASNTFPHGQLICFYGPPGTGKTTIIKNEFKHFISIEADILKTRQGTLDFMERISSTSLPIVIDNWESVSDLIGIREIDKAVSKNSPTIFISHTPIKLTKETILYECPNKEDFRRRELGPGMDTFETPKDYVHRLLRGDWKSVKIGDVTHEHGHVWSIIQENYPDRTDLMSDIADLMSEADLIDSLIYQQSDWGVVMPLFTAVSCLQPCSLMNPSNKVPRTGSMWTKYQNACMRQKKLDALFLRSGRKLSHDALCTVIKNQFQKDDFSACKEYNLEPTDIDVLGHVTGPFKPKILAAAKKLCV